MTKEHVELSDETMQRLEDFVEEREMFPLTILGTDRIINNLLDYIEELEQKCERLETQREV